MTTVTEATEPVRLVGAVVPARSRASRATILAVLSRLVIAAGMVSGVWAGLIVRDTASAPDLVTPVPALVRAPVEESVGTTIAELLVGLEAALLGSSAHLLELEIGAPDGVRVPVVLRLELPSGGAVAVERIVRALEGSRFEAVNARSVTPVPGGARLDIAARVTLASLAPIRELEVVRPAAVALTDAVTRSGAYLQHLEVPTEDAAPIRMEVRGDLATLATLVGDLEEHHTAPLRFVSLMLRAGAEELVEARLIFRTSLHAMQGGGRESS